jgi:predicted nucleic acid-binding protein
MILCDTSVIVSAINDTDKDHALCVGVLRSLEERIITTRACVTEPMHLIRNYAGWNGQLALMEWIEADFLIIYTARPKEDKRACALMRQYADSPMDFADATLVAAAESLRITRVLTLDRHFYAYLIAGKTAFQVLPNLTAS